MYKDNSCSSSPLPDIIAAAADASETPLNNDNNDSSESDTAAAPVAITASNKNSPRQRLSRRLSSSTSSSSTTSSSGGSKGIRRHRNHCDDIDDVKLLRKIGYIASRVRFLGKLYGDFKLVNPYSPAKQRRQLESILLHHSIGGPPAGACLARSITPASSVASSYCCLTTDSSLDGGAPDSIGSSGGGTRPRRASIVILEDLLIQFYEDHNKKLTVIRRRSVGNGTTNSVRRGSIRQQQQQHHNQFVIMSGNSCSSVERLLQTTNDNDDDDSSSVAGLESAAVNVTATTSDNSLLKRRNFLNANGAKEQRDSSATPTPTPTPPPPPPTSTSSSQLMLRNAFLNPSAAGLFDECPRRRRSSDCITTSSNTTTALLYPACSNQLQVTLKNNCNNNNNNNNNSNNNNINCSGFSTTQQRQQRQQQYPFHRGSCGAAGEHLLAANSIANRSTIILSKSCSNVDGGSSTATLYGTGSSTRGAPGANEITGVGSVLAAGSNTGTTTATSANGNNEFSVVQLNNTIIQCHFNDDDFRALVKDLKRKVEYTERMNWLCLSKRPMGPPHRKSSLPKHQEVKKRFLEICDTTFSDEVKAALRLPAFDSYEWSDADVIHLMQTMFIDLGFIEKFHLPLDTLREWLYEVYKHYNEVPFHNFRHCFCVAQMMYAITKQANLISRIGDLECLILLVACICHDLDHPGYNNIYQINARTELALRYNDISPLENHHCSIAFRLLEHPDCNIFKNFSREAFNQIREGIIRCILATDMARHNEILTQFKEITPVFDYSNRSHINLLCMILIKVADISNEARPMDVAEPWLDRLLQEFFAQSAAEKSEGLPVTPFMDPDKVSKPGSQVRFIGLVLLPLFEALGDLVPELTELIIIPVRVALDYYKRLNDAQNKSRKSVFEATSENSCSDGGSGGGGGGGGSGGGVGGVSGSGTGAGTGSLSPQLPRSQSGISVKSRRSMPSQKSASRTSVDEPTCIAAELHDLPEGSESGDSETATEVDVAEKTSKFKVDTEGSSNRSKSSHSTSRKSSREKRPSMIGEMCSAGGGNRIRNSYGNIHGYHSNRCHFGSNRAVSLDQYSCNNRRLSDGLPQVISDSNVFYNRNNRGSIDTDTHSQHHHHQNLHHQHQQLHCDAANKPKIGGGTEVVGGGGGIGLSAISTGLDDDNDDEHGGGTDDALNMNAPARDGVDRMPPATVAGGVGLAGGSQGSESVTVNGALSSNLESNIVGDLNNRNISTNGNCSINNMTTAQKPPPPPQQHCCAAAAAAAAAAASSLNGSKSSSWKTRFKQFSDYFSFSFDKGHKRYASTRSSPCSVRNNNAIAAELPPSSKQSAGICCTIANNFSPNLKLKQQQQQQQQQQLQDTGRNRAYSLDVPMARNRYSSSSGGAGDSRKSSRNEDNSNNSRVNDLLNNAAHYGNEDNNSNTTIHSGIGNEMPPIRIDGGSSFGDGGDMHAPLPPLDGSIHHKASIGEVTVSGGSEYHSASIDLGMHSGSSSDPSKI